MPEQPTTPRARRQRAAEHVAHPDPECEACVELGLVRAEAAASVPAPEQEEAVRLREVMLRAADEAAAGTGDCECGLPMDAHAGGMSLMHHDNYMRDLYAAALATPPPVPAAPGLDDSERALLRELATGGVAFEIPGKYVEVQHDPGTWHRAQEWFRLHPADPEEA